MRTRVKKKRTLREQEQAVTRIQPVISDWLYERMFAEMGRSRRNVSEIVQEALEGHLTECERRASLAS